MSKTKPTDPIIKEHTYPNGSVQEFYECPVCGAEVEWGCEYLMVMYDDITQAGEGESDYCYCPECDWDNEEISHERFREAFEGLFYY